MSRMQTFTAAELDMIHRASMDILERTGIDFNHVSTADMFKSRGIKTRGTAVFPTERQVMDAVGRAPSRFRIHARNPKNTVDVGGDDFIIMPTGGAPKVAEPDGNHRLGTLSDFTTCCKLVQTSDQIDAGGYIMVQPNDIPADTAHLDMISTYLLLCDKPLFGGSANAEAAKDTIEMAGLVFGGRDALDKKPVMISVVNSASPLQFAREQTEVIHIMAGCRQPIIIANMILAGASGPVSLPSLLALQNAEILAGIFLAQTVAPGTPVVYGSTSAPMDMKTMCSAVGAAETVKIANATVQLARYYHLPSRCGGSLTDAHVPDAQATAEGAMMLSTVVRNGANVIYHACGQIGSYIAMSFEKWIIDEEICRMLRETLKPISISSESFDMDLIHEVGPGGQYLTHPKTFEQFRQLSQPYLFNRKDYSKWKACGGRYIHDQARAELKERLAAYQRPYVEPEIERALRRYVARKKL